MLIERLFLSSSFFGRSLFAIVLIVAAEPHFLAAEEVVSIGGGLGLFVDDYLIERTEGDAAKRLKHPAAQEVSLVTDAPWEGNTCAYYTIFQDGDLYRMYYRGSHFDTETQKASHPEFTCYAESKDGIHWTKPELGLVEFDGSTKNNIVWDGIGTHCFTVFKDANPDCDPAARYKAISAGRPKGLYVFGSADGIHWRLLHDRAVITNGDFDSQNLAFWDATRKLYVDYHRKSRDGKRDIMTATSTDFLEWTEPVFLEYSGAPREHLYTNAVQPYLRSPDVYIGLPTRFLPESSQVAPTLMTSRDGLNFHRWAEPLIPITAPEDRDGNRSNYMTWGMLQLPGSERELSVYATEAYYTGPDSRVRRFTFRVDGFVSLGAGVSGGAVVTKPLAFAGKRLVVNYAAAKGGQIRVELEDAEGNAIDGFGIDDCRPLIGDEILGSVTWKGRHDVSRLAGSAVRLRFEMENAEVFSFRFVDGDE